MGTSPNGPGAHDEPRTQPLDEIRDWASAIFYGIGDTLGDMLRAGRRASREATDEYWDRFDRKTRFRREPEDPPPEGDD